MKIFPRILAFSILLIAPSILSAQTSWSNAIAAVSEKSSAYYDFALSLGSGHPGSALHGIGYERHICAIIGRMLGFQSEIRQAETFEDPPRTVQADPMEIMQHAVFLDSWVAAARNATSMTEIQKKSLWNLECVGEHGIPVSAYIDDPELHGDFSVRDGTLLVYGDIDWGIHERFTEALDDHQGVATIAFGSAGGSVMDAILIGMEIRMRGLATTLHGPCYSACPLAFMGGTERRIWMGPGPHLGFHRVYTTSGAVPLDDEIYDQIGKYLVLMDVDPLPVLKWMASAEPSEMHKPELEELCVPGVATWIQRTCGF